VSELPDEEEQTGEGESLSVTTNTARRFEVSTISGRTVVSDVSSLAEAQARLCLLTRCITRHIFPFQKFILLDSELDYGGRLQQRICYKLNVVHDPKGYWESNREAVRVKLTKKRNNVTESIRRKMEGTYPPKIIVFIKRNEHSHSKLVSNSPILKK
jgi:hypothetical protein